MGCIGRGYGLELRREFMRENVGRAPVIGRGGESCVRRGAYRGLVQPMFGHIREGTSLLWGFKFVTRVAVGYRGLGGYLLGSVAMYVIAGERNIEQCTGILVKASYVCEDLCSGPGDNCSSGSGLPPSAS